MSPDKKGNDGPELVQIQPVSDPDGGPRQEDRDSDVVNHDDENTAERISIAEVVRLQRAGQPVVILDVRTERSLETSDLQIQGAVRLPPDDVVRQANKLNLPKNAWLIAYCA